MKRETALEKIDRCIGALSVLKRELARGTGDPAIPEMRARIIRNELDHMLRSITDPEMDEKREGSQPSQVREIPQLRQR